MDMRHSTHDEADQFRAEVSARVLTVERNERLWLRLIQVAIIVIAVVVLAGALVAARAILIPIVAAVIIGSVIGPAIEALGRRGIPTLLASFLIVGLLCGVFYGVAAALAAPLADWVNRAPEIGKLMQERFEAPRPTRLAVLRVFRAIETRLGAYLVTATFINLGLGVATA
jgi:predicted PurR-regulated permease PerM